MFPQAKTETQPMSETNVGISEECSKNNFPIIDIVRFEVIVL